MRFIFRPLVSYASSLKKRCLDIAMGMRSGVVSRIHDGFLIKITKRKDTAIADVIDLDGVFIAPICEDMQYIPPSTISVTNYWHPAMKIKAPGNPTIIAISEENPVFADALECEWVLPAGYIGRNPWPPSYTGPGCQHSVGGGWISTAALANWGTTWDTMEVLVSRINTNVRSEAGEAAYGSAALEPDDTPAAVGGVQTVSIPFADFGLPPELTTSPPVGTSLVGNAVFAVADSGGGYVAVYARYSDSGSSGGPMNVVSIAEMAILRYDLVAQPDGRVVCVTSKVFGFGEADANPEDRQGSFTAFDIYDYLPPDPPAGYSVEVVAGANPNIDPALLGWYRNLPDGVYNWSISKPTLETENQFDSAPRTSAVAFDGGIAVMFTVVTYLECERLTVRFTDVENPASFIDVDVPQTPARHEATYRLRITADGNQLKRVHASTVAQADQRWRDNRFVQLYPVGHSYLNNEPVFICHRLSTESEVLEVAATGAIVKYHCPGFRMAADDTDLVAVLPSGAVVEIRTPDDYPTGYSTVAGRTGYTSGGYFVDDEIKRWNFGRQFPRTIDLGGFLEESVCFIACHYAPGHGVALVAPKSTFMSPGQLARLVVFKVETGEVVAQSGYAVGFNVSSGDRLEGMSRWHVSCVQEGAVDENGDLTVHAHLLLTLNTRFGFGYVFMTKDLSTFTRVGTSLDPFRCGPVYYVGTPLATAEVGKTTSRSFFAGKPVEPP